MSGRVLHQAEIRTPRIGGRIIHPAVRIDLQKVGGSPGIYPDIATAKTCSPQRDEESTRLVPQAIGK